MLFRSRARYRGYARNVGLAFQIADDLLDHEGDEEAAGKKLQKDAEAGKATFVSLLGADRANIWAMGISAVSTLAAALAMTPLVVGIAVTINGACWITVIANNGAAVQMILPNFMRARGMAVHQMVFFGSMVVGSLLWGHVADLWHAQTALLLSALALVPLTAVAALIRLPGSSQPRV